MSDTTNANRRNIARALGTAMGLGILLVVSAVVVEIASSSEKGAEALILLRSLAVSGIVLFGSSLWYLVRWEVRWQQTHATAELQNRKNRKDMLRASWLAELSIEVGKDEKDKTRFHPVRGDVAGAIRGAGRGAGDRASTGSPLQAGATRSPWFGKTGIELAKRPRPDK